MWKDENGEWNVINIVSFVCIFVVFLFILFAMYLRIRYRFFYKVRDMYVIYQYYNLLYAPYKPINTYRKLEYLKKHVSAYDIKVHSVQEKSDTELDALLDTLTTFVKKHSIRVKHQVDYSCEVDREYMRNIVCHHEKPSYIACHYDLYKDVKSLFALFPVYVYEHRQKSKSMMYYIDYSVTLPKYRHQESIMILSTTTGVEIMKRYVDEEYPDKETSSMGFLFKTEHTKLPIMPLLSYKSIVYDLDSVSFVESLLGYEKTTRFEPLQLIRVDKNNIRIFKDIFKYVLEKKNYTRMFCVTTGYTNLYDCILQNVIHVYMIMMKDEVYGMFLFKDIRYAYKKEPMIECIASFWFEKKHDSRDLTIDLYLWCLYDLKRIHRFRYIVLNVLGENWKLFDSLTRRGLLGLYHVPCYYYAINYIQKPYSSEESFMMV